MGENEVITAINKVGDEVRQTSERLDENTAWLARAIKRLDELNGQGDSLEHPVYEGFADRNAKLDLDWRVTMRQLAESEVRLATAVVSLAAVTEDIRHLLDIERNPE